MHVLQYAYKKETFNNHVIPLHVQVLSLSSVFSSLAFVSLVRLSSALCFFFFFFSISQAHRRSSTVPDVDSYMCSENGQLSRSILL